MVLVAVVSEGQDTDSAAGIEDTGYLNIAGVHESDKVLHDDIDAILVEVTVVTEREEVEFEGLGFHHSFTGNIGDDDSSVIGLTGFGAEGSELRAVERHHIVVLLVEIYERFQ